MERPIYSSKRQQAENWLQAQKTRPQYVAQQYADLLDQELVEYEKTSTLDSGFNQEVINGILSKYGPSYLDHALQSHIDLLNGNGQNAAHRGSLYTEFADGVQVYAHMLGQGESAQPYHLMAASLHMRAVLAYGGVSRENAQAVFTCLGKVEPEFIPPYLQPVLLKSPR